jgi:hypothetical protein
VSKVIMRFLQNAKAFVRLHYELMSAMGFSTPEVSLKDEESRGVIYECCEFVIWKVSWSFARDKKMLRLHERRVNRLCCF